MPEGVVQFKGKYFRKAALLLGDSFVLVVLYFICVRRFTKLNDIDLTVSAV